LSDDFLLDKFGILTHSKRDVKNVVAQKISKFSDFRPIIVLYKYSIEKDKKYL
jgi:hypothetical protein